MHEPGQEQKRVRHHFLSCCCQDGKVRSTFLHLALQHRSVSENQHVEDSLTGAVKGSVEIDVATGLFAAAVLAVDVAVDP